MSAQSFSGSENKTLENLTKQQKLDLIEDIKREWDTGRRHSCEAVITALYLAAKSLAVDTADRPIKSTERKTWASHNIASAALNAEPRQNSLAAAREHQFSLDSYKLRLLELVQETAELYAAPPGVTLALSNAILNTN